MTNEERIKNANIIGLQCETERGERYTVAITKEQAALIKGEWTSVEERLPEEGQPILLIFKHLGYINGKLVSEEYVSPCAGRFFSEDDSWFKGTAFGGEGCKVVSHPAYWLPIPDFSQFKNNDKTR